MITWVQIARLLHRVFEFCYPDVCANCQALGDEGYLCPACRMQLDLLAGHPACERCARPLATHGSPCPSCKGRGIAPFDRVVSLGVYEEPLRSLVLGMKYHHRWPLAEHLADHLIASERATGLLQETQVLVPVPLHMKRHVKRGYNQAEVLARHISRRCDIPIAFAAKRVRDTETQTHLHSHDKRLANLRGAFALTKPKSIHAKHVVIVDDVMTTGATLKSLAYTLKEAAPASLCALVLGVADPKGRAFEVS